MWTSLTAACLGPYPQQPVRPSSTSIRSDATLRDPNLDHASSRPASPSPQPTVIPWPQTSQSASNSTPEFYGPDRLFQPTLIPAETPRRSTSLPFQLPNIQFGAMEGRTDIEGQMNAAMLTGFRDELVREAGVVTPGVDDTPYIHYAIEALTRDRDTGYSGNETTASDAAIHIPPVVPSQGMEYRQPPLAQEQWQQQPPQGQWRRQSGQEQADRSIPQERWDPLFPQERWEQSPVGAQWQQSVSPAQGPMQPPPVYHHEDQTHGQPSRIRQLASLGTGSLGPEDSRIPSPWAPRLKPDTIQPHQWRAVDRDAMRDSISREKASGFPPLRFLPWILQPASFAILMVLCLFMMTALIFSAVYSELNQGLQPFSGTIYGSQYFLFRMLPQLFAAVIFMYAQCVVTAMFRIIPFVQLSSNRSREREGAIFQDLYPNWFLWPRLIGSWRIWVPILITWLLCITIPLQSSLFTVILVDGVWTWATVQGVAWTLVALYVALLVATVIGFSFWSRVGKTGLLWDPRSLADIVAIVSGTNTAADYQGTQLAGTKDRLRFALRRRGGDKLSYWTWKDGRGGFWYTLGNSMDDESSLPFPDIPEAHGAKAERDRDSNFGRDIEAAEHQSRARYRFLPWFMRSSQLLLMVVTAFVLLLALFIVSFLPSTHITAGFRPWLQAAPQPGAFSAADFLYSFLPALVGLILWLFFQALDLSLRVHQPWAALAGPRGAAAEESLLADYAACVPIQSTIHALRRGHWRVAIVSALSTLFLLLPVLGGGMFMALARGDGQVRMYPNVPAFAISLSLLVLYFLAIVGLFAGRSAFRLPHAVDCLAEIVSFLANKDLLADPAFKGCRTRSDMLRQMGLAAGTRETQPRWMFGASPASSAADGMPGVRRVRLFTEKRPIRKSQIRRGGRHGV